MSKHIHAVSFILAIILLTAFTLPSCTSETSENIADYDLEYYIVLPEYMGITLSDESIEVTEDDISEVIEEHIAEHTGEAKLSNGQSLLLGDTVNINYTGYVIGNYDEYSDGDVFSKCTWSSGYELTLGSNTFAPGFEDDLVGCKVGETVDIYIDFPEDFSQSPQLAGVSTRFEVTINSAVREYAPNYDDDFVSAYTDYSTTEEYETAIYEELRAEADETELSRYYYDILTYLKGSSTVISYPDAVIEAAVSNLKSSIESSYGVTIEEYLSLYGLTEDELEASLLAEAEENILEAMIVYRVAELEEITLNTNEYEAGLEKYASSYGYSDADDFEDSAGVALATEIILMYKVLGYIYESASIES